jgi:hypothetical protein
MKLGWTCRRRIKKENQAHCLLRSTSSVPTFHTEKNTKIEVLVDTLAILAGVGGGSKAFLSVLCGDLVSLYYVFGI